MRKNCSIDLTSTRFFTPRSQAVVFLLCLASLFTASTAAFAQVRIMPLGNSITQADHNHDSYRRPLWFKLKDGGYNVDFVGSQNSSFNAPSPHPDFDLNHEGHWGWRADQILGSVQDWATANTPDIVLMHVGTNDMLQGQSVESTLDEISQIVDRLRVANPSVKILMAQLIPTTQSGPNANLNILNSLIPGLASQKTTSQSPIIVVDQNSGFDASTLTYDGIHPREGGEELMASRWYQALQAVLATGVPAPAPPAPSPPAPAPDPAPIVLREADNPSNVVNGLAYRYYEGSWSALPDFNSQATVKQGTTNAFDLNVGGRADNFGFRYTGYIEVPTDGEYTFYTSSDDGSQLFIGSQLVVDNNGIHAAQERSGVIGLKAGKHALTVTFFERDGGETLAVSYQGPGVGKQPVPASALFRENTTAAPLPGAFYRAINIDGPALTIDGHSWLASDGNIDVSGQNGAFSDFSIALNPGTDAERATMLRSSVWGGNTTLNVLNVDNGTYDVFLYVWEDNSPATFGIHLENKLVVAEHNSGEAGQWSKLGPFRAEVSDGNLTVRTTGGDANLSGIELWQAAPSSLQAAAGVASLKGPAGSGKGLQVYPQPLRRGQEALNLEFAELQGPAQITIYDRTGRQVYQAKAIGQHRVPSQALPAGLYLISVNDGHKTLTSKLVIN
ncbi:PA14 domain-containing protein [Hymenobacter jejuensis]|uniref:T9SS type A sorting domain-containing protein n=1 Tax=Hymenobacter jejuensis TaxID=2502781 RepID=A0A5B7ZX08_9BACT|nr:PA14 domain-containing protein [Hymenobacter jejuensis]QDA59510.1 T9SS type A sorting domain-containing protein [Hymenobacter jejuensis]